MRDTTPSSETLTAMLRHALGRGLDRADAEDVVHGAWLRCTATFEPGRGTFDAYLWSAVRRGCAQWWRDRARSVRPLGDEVPALRLVDDEAKELATREATARRHEQLLAALTDPERQVFAAWALQKQLGKVKLPSAKAAASLGLTPRAYENAKRRLKYRLETLARNLEVADVGRG